MNKRILFPLCAAAVALTAGAQDYRQADQYLQQVAQETFAEEGMTRLVIK